MVGQTRRQFRVGQGGQPKTAGDHQIHARQHFPMVAKAFADDSLKPTAIHRTRRGFAGNREPQPGRRVPIQAAEHLDLRIEGLARLGKNALIVWLGE